MLPFSWLFLILIWCISNQLHGQVGVGAESIAQGSVASVGSKTWAIFNNPSQINGKQTTFGFGFSQRYQLKEIQDIIFRTYSQLGSYHLGLGILRFGTQELYSETQIRIGIAKNIFNTKQGLSLSYTNIDQGGDYPSYGRWHISYGLQIQVKSDIMIGSTIESIVFWGNKQATIGYNRKLNFGIEWGYLQPWGVLTEVHFEQNYNPGIRLGFNYKIIDLLEWKMGYTTVPSTISMGFIVKYNNIKTAMSGQFHTDLETSLALDVIFNLSK